MPIGAGVEGEAMNRADKLKLVRSRYNVIINEKLDDALDNSFPASDPVSLGHSDRIGQPTSVPRKAGKLPKGSAGLKLKRFPHITDVA
jgi:hypothetical protein